MAQRFEATSGGTRIVGEQQGQGDSVIFLHAGVADRRMFHSQLQALGTEHRAVAYDRRGFGETTTPNEPFAHTDDLTQVMRHLGIERSLLVGCSQGGAIALAFTLAHPEAVNGLVLISTAIPGAPEPAIPSHLEPIVQAYDDADEADDPVVLNEIEAHVWLDGPGSVKGRVSGSARELFLDMNGRALAHPELSKERKPGPVFESVGDIAVPVMLISGSLDFPHVHAQHAHLESHLQDVTAYTIDKAAHLPPMDQSALVNRYLLEFCKLG